MLIKDVVSVLKKAKAGNYAIPGTNFFDLDSARIFSEISEQKKLPVMLSFAQVHSDSITIEEAAEIGKYYADYYKDSQVILHLDHGQDVDYVKHAIELGFTSVMIDASAYSFDENVRITKEITSYAKPLGIQVEAEIGHVGSNVVSEDTNLYTEPDEAAEFVKQSGCDSLAVSIGTSHGAYKNGTPKLNFEILESLAKALPDTPLVLHGGSGSGDDNLNRASVNGISKVNICTDFLVAGKTAYLEAAKNTDNDYLACRIAMRKAMGDMLIHYYKVFETKP